MRYLFQRELHVEATEVLRLLSTHKGVVDETVLASTVAEITEAIALESNQAGWSELWKDDEVRSRRRVFLACVLNACQAWSGSTPVSYYTTYMSVLPTQQKEKKYANRKASDSRTPSVYPTTQPFSCQASYKSGSSSLRSERGGASRSLAAGFPSCGRQWVCL
jgi:hypothetical protein